MTSNYPRFRTHVKRGKGGRVWTSYWFDNRGSGPDIALGTDRAAALAKWAEITTGSRRIAGTIEEAFAAWERADDGLLRDLKEHTKAGYVKCLRALRPVFRAARWEEVSLQVLAQYVRARTAKARARQEMQLLAVIWNWSRLQGYTDLHWPGKDMGKTAWKGLSKARQVEVSDEAFDALYSHACPCLRDAMDIASSTGLRVEDVLRLRLSDVRGNVLTSDAGKTGKRAEFDISGSVIAQIVERRRAVFPEHLSLLFEGKRPVTYRRLAARFEKARAAAAKEVPECAGLILRDMRKRAAQKSGSLAEASTLLQHSSLSVTRKHYRSGAEKLRPVR